MYEIIFRTVPVLCRTCVGTVASLMCVNRPLYDLLRKGKPWDWTSVCESSFNKIKAILCSTEVLAHYDPASQLILTCDASPVGIGGVLTQVGTDGCERPVSYISRTLSQAEQNYSQIDREALAIVFSLQKFHQYVYGRRIVLRTDHKPLVSIFGPKKGIPMMAASRLQRWSVIVAAYTYDIVYINTTNNGADSLSRLPIPANPKDLLPYTEQSYLHYVNNSMLLDYQEIKKQTSHDPLLSRVLGYIRDGWPEQNEIRALQPYFNRKTELYEELGCIMWGHRIVVPTNCTQRVLSDLHECHMGIVKTKAMARSYVWWAGVDEAVEAMCRSCAVCSAEADAPPRRAPQPWPYPNQPWSRIHADFLGPIDGKLYLVVVDARTKWLEVFNVPSTSANSVISKLSELFGRWGVVKQLVTDNGPPFTSQEVSSYLNRNGVQHLFSAPYHPASNGAAENAVRTIKKVIKKARRQNINVELAIQTFLLHYRNTPHCTTGESPASLMLGRPLRTKFDLLRPDCSARVQAAQQRQCAVRGGAGSAGGGAARQLPSGEPVWLRQYQQGADRWAPGTVAHRIGTTDYTVLDSSGRRHHRHIDQLRQRHRSSLVNPSTPAEQESRDEPVQEDAQVEEWVSPPTSPQANDNLVDTDTRGEGGGASTAMRPRPLSPAVDRDPHSPAVPCRRNPIIQCHLQKPPDYRN